MERRQPCPPYPWPRGYRRETAGPNTPVRTRRSAHLEGADESAGSERDGCQGMRWGVMQHVTTENAGRVRCEAGAIGGNGVHPA